MHKSHVRTRPDAETFPRSLGSLDLRLLQIFDALCRLRSVSETARVLDIPQPAVSQGLRRLRHVFDDELFLRSARRMEPTSRALALREPIAAIAEIARDRLFCAPAFVPIESRREFRLLATDFGGVTLLSLLLPRLRTVAPLVRLRILPMDSTVFTHLDAGRADLATGIVADTLLGFKSRIVFTDRYVLAMRTSHPLLRGRPSAAAFRRASYVVVTSRIGSADDAEKAMSASLLPGQIAMRVPSYALFPTILANTDLIAVVPSTASRALFPSDEISYVGPPFDVPPITVALVWHERGDSDPALSWLIDEISALFRKLPQPA